MTNLWEVRGEFFPHRSLWVDARNLLDLFDDLETGCAHSAGLGALVLMHCTLEGFANFLGEKLRPEVWADERSLFGGGHLQARAYTSTSIQELRGPALRNITGHSSGTLTPV